MGKLAGARCYLSGPIEHSTEDDWRGPIIKTLTDRFGIRIFDPFADPKQQWKQLLDQARRDCDYATMRKIAKSFVRKDLALVDRADFVIAYLPYRVATTGTIHEIVNSVNAKKPTILVCEQGKQLVPLWFYGCVPHEVMFGSCEELYAYLQEVDDGKHADNHRWSFVYGII